MKKFFILLSIFSILFIAFCDARKRFLEFDSIKETEMYKIKKEKIRQQTKENLKKIIYNTEKQTK